MTKSSIALLAAASLALLAAGSASAQDTKAYDGTYKGTMVCAQVGGQREVVRVPMDITVTNGAITLARPIVTANNQVVATELAKGTIEADGFTLVSIGENHGTRYQGKYTGAIVVDGGTFTGTQVWSQGDVTRTRTCTGAFVQAGV